MCSLFPSGELVPSERPDFRLHSSEGTIGIEVTQLSLAEALGEAERLAKVVDRAKEIYNKSADAEPVDVDIAFGPNAVDMSSDDLRKSLVQFVQTHRGIREVEFDSRELPEGYCYIDILDPLPDTDATGSWTSGKGFTTELASEQSIATRISEKNSKLSDYRISAPVVWLLIINDQSMGPGQVYATPQDIAKWTFNFDFDKVLLFSRELGGNGEVFELQRK